MQTYFEKPHRSKQEVALRPQKDIDPYIQNEIKGTRMPEYSKLSLERDVFGELGWIPNFEVKKSKNNEKAHLNYRELFDNPKDYTTEFHTGSMTNTEFFRQNAPDSSVAKAKTPDLNSIGSAQGSETAGRSTRRSFNPLERKAFSATRRSAKIAEKPFVLRPETSNRYKVH